MNLSSFINECYEVCDDWTLKIQLDQWWVTKVTCKHHSFKKNGKSSDIDNIMKNLLTEINSYHKNIK